MDSAAYRARVREDLRDTDAANYYWTDAEIDGAVERAVQEFNIAWGETIAIGDIPALYAEVVVLGATGYLAMSASVDTVHKLSTSGRFTAQGFRDWGQQRMERYESQLKSLAKSRKPQGIISTTLKGEDE